MNLPVARPHRRETLLVEPASLDRMRARRVVVVMGAVIPEQLVLWRAVKELGIELTIIGTDANIYGGKWPWHPRMPPGLDCVLLRPLSPAVERGHLWWMYRGLGRSLAQLRPALLHVVSEPWGALVLQTLLLRWKARPGAPVCVHGADNIFDHGSRAEQLARRLILAGVWPRIDGYTSWSRGGIEAAQGRGLPPIPTAVVPGIVPDPSHFSSTGYQKEQARSRLGLPEDEPVVGYFGRLDHEKGIGDLVQATRSLGVSAPFLAIWGAGAMEGLIRELMSAGRVRGSFGGALALTEVPEALQACDIVVIPSKTTSQWKEQFGRVVVEAMMAGSAVVAYRSGAIPEVLGRGGWLVDEGDVQGLAAAIRHLVTHNADRLELAARGRREALTRFRPRVLAEGLVRLWSEVFAQWQS